MSGISSLGVGSGLDLDSLVQGLLRAEREPQEARLNRDQTRARTTLSALGGLQSSIAGLVSATNELKDFQVGMNVASSDRARAEATVTGDADTGSFQIRIDQLAAAQSLASQAFEDLDENLGAGTLSVTIDGETVNLEFGEETSSLRDVRDALNASDAEIQAAIVRDGGQYRLLLTSAVSGAKGTMSLEVTGLDARLASAQMDETTAAADAQFSVNGLELASSSNVIEDLLPGLSLTLKQETEGTETITLSVSTDRSGVRKRLEAFVSAYNKLTDNMRTAGRADPEGDRSGPLVGDSTLRAVQSRISGAFSSTVPMDEGSGTFATLLDLGLSTDLQGRARLDSERLEAALEQDQAGVEALVANFAANFGATLEGFSDKGGVLGSRTESLNAELRRITARRAALDRRMDQVETRLRRQFSALDSLLAEFQSTSAFLGQQLAGLASLRP